MGDVPPEDATGGEETPSREPSLFDKASVSAGGQIYTDTELGQYFYGGRGYLSQYGWYIVLVVVCVGVVWMKLGPAVKGWWAKRKQREEELNFDPVKAEQHEDGLLRARERMQRLQDERAAEHQQKAEERSAEERDEKINQWETFGVVGKSKKTKPSAPPPSRRDYFPMSGHGGGGGYRPARRNVGGGG
ncbi:Selenoprotein S [Geodia barretti]|uniref:Selenoprotein S n=2 Tax=Geodia barretti TaxID=519541 RepID=A0AA35SFI6_GEOBA|nr:Selenoprotein S [Geodia barretti]